MSVGPRGLHLKITNFILFISNGMTKTKLAILAFLYYEEFVKITDSVWRGFLINADWSAALS